MNDAVSATAAIPPLRLSALMANALTVPLRGSAPPALTQLPVGQSVQATVMSYSGAGILQLKSDMGSFSLRLAVPVPEGTVLTLQSAIGPFPQMRIVLVNGKPAAQALSRLMTKGGEAGGNDGRKAGNAAVPRQDDGVIPSRAGALRNGMNAFVVRSAEHGVPLSAGVASPLLPGTRLSVRIVAFGQPDGAGNAGDVQGRSSVTAMPAATPTAAGSVVMPPSGGPAVAGSGQTIAPIMLSGLIVDQLSSGQTLVQTALGTLSLVMVPMPQGTPVVLEVAGLASSPAIIGPTALLPPPPLPGWQGLADAFNAIRIAEPAWAQSFLNTLPTPGDRMAPALVALVAGIRGGGGEGVFGTDFFRRLNRLADGDKRDRAVRHDIGAMCSAMERPSGPGGEWRTFSLPFNSGYTIEPIRLNVRPPPCDEENGDKSKGKKEGTRFIVDIALGVLGPLQLDGLIQRDRRQFDMIIRTNTEMPQEMRQDIAIIFTEACRTLGMTGNAQFQVTTEFFNLLPPMAVLQHGILA